jgi:hypothetical protein
MHKFYYDLLWILISLFLKNGNRRGTWTLYLNISYVQNVWLSGNTPVCILIFVGRQDTLTVFFYLVLSQHLYIDSPSFVPSQEDFPD